MMKKNRYSRRGKSNFRNDKMNNDNDKNDERCCECGKHGHIQAGCPELKKKLSRNFQKKKSFGAWSDEEESDQEEIAYICFMVINDDSNEDSGELGLMADEGTSEVRLPTCPNCHELQEFIDIALADMEKVLNELRKIQREKKDWALKLEVCEIERDMLQEEVNELQLQLSGLRKSASHSSVKSNQYVSHKFTTRNTSSCIHYGKSGHKSNHCRYRIKTEKGYENSNNPLCIYCGKFGHSSNHCRLKNNKKWVWRPKASSQANTQNANHLGSKQAWVLRTINFLLQEQRKRNRKGKWYLDSTCSSHMTGDKQVFKTVTKFDEGTITFGDKSKGNVIGVGRVHLSSTCDVDEVYLVDELGYNLLSISQLCDNDYEARFKKIWLAY
nr:uncharacterized protein LOC104098006 [Nicotiana tomentosiformis]